jgi:hypothetical protein
VGDEDAGGSRDVTSLTLCLTEAVA